MLTNINTTGRLYKVGDRVYFGYNRINVHDQRGRLFVKYKGKQVNIKDIPALPPLPDPVFNYIFNRQFMTHSCPAMDYWIMRHRMKQNINTRGYKAKYL